MKRGSTKFWLCVSLALAAPGCLGSRRAFWRAGNAAQATVHHTNETLLAGLRPGRDTFAMAEKRFKPKNLSEDRDSGV